MVFIDYFGLATVLAYLDGVLKMTNNMSEKEENKKQEREGKINELLEKAVEAGIKAGLRWQGKVFLRCAIEGCRYGIEGVDKEPRDNCMYCGSQNISKTINSLSPELRSAFQNITTKKDLEK